MASAALKAGAAAVARAMGSKSSTSATPSREYVVRLLTFNIWFDPLVIPTRMRAIGQIVERTRPAVIGFQEVTRESLQLLRKQQWSRYYDCSIDTAPPFSEAYFVVLFSALPVLALESMPFHNTGMGRELLTMTVQVALGHSFIVATSHLESLPQFKRQRVSQLKQSLTCLGERVADGGVAHTTCLGGVLMGDMNLIRGDMKLLDPRCAESAEITVEEAPTGRSRCRCCRGSIEKGTVRVGKTGNDTLPGGRTVTITLWYHKSCFLEDQSTTEDDKQTVLSSPLSRVDNASDDAVERPDPATLGLPPLWRDLWLSVPGNTEDNGYTYDGKRNAVIKKKSYQSRLDRVYFRPGPSVHETVFEKIEMVGTEPIADGLWPSDHFGLLATLNFDDVINNKDANNNEDDAVKRQRRGADQAGSDGSAQPGSGSRSAPIELD